ncbi:MAG: YARHG domain-containing protein [Clostridiales bacterium]|nr:YARHG domain-containing protein [Clostridiales bacterium]
MSMNTNDPLHPQPLQSQSPVQPQSPVLAPDSPVLAPHPAPAQPVNTPDPTEPPKKGKGKIIAIVSIMGVVIVGLIVVIVLLLTGVIGGTKETEATKKTKAGNGKKTSAVETDDDPTEEPTEDPTEAPTDTSDPSGNPNTGGRHLFVESASDISDSQLREMRQFAEDFFKTDESTSMPPAVNVDLFNYVGLNISHWDTDSQVGHVCLFYQVQITDKTGPEPVHRNYFWMIGFTEVYQDGYLDTSILFTLGDSLYFEDWSTAGILSIDGFRDDLRRDGNIIVEDTVDEALFQPLPGDSTYVPQERLGVTSADQVSPAQMTAMKEEARELFGIMANLNNASLKEMKLLGTVVGSNGKDSMFYLVYEVDITYGNQGTDTFYWYVGFPGVYQGGELDMTYFDPPWYEIGRNGWTANGVESVDELIYQITGEYGYYYEVRVGENSDPGTSATTSNSDGFIFPDSDTDEIPDADIKALSDEDLRMAINEIWARHGYIFRNKDILEYYRQFDWYEEKVTADEWDKNGQEKYLNDVELHNIKKLVDERESRT